MKPYFAILDARFRGLLQYRASAIAGIGTQLFFGYVRVMIFMAFYASSAAAQPMTADQVVSYIWLSQAFLLLAMFGVEPEIAAMIRSGGVAYELTRPVDLYSLWFSRCLAARLAPTLLRAVPQLILAYAFLGLAAPTSLPAFGWFLAAIVSGAVLAAAISAALTISMLWTISGEGITRLAPAVIFLFSGIIIPLPLFPDWLQPIVQSLPFRGLIDVPFQMYLGLLTGRDALIALVQTWAWTAGFIMIGRLALNRGLKQLVAQGG